MPDAVALFPVAGGLPALRLHRRPAIGKPNKWLAIAAGFHEGEPLAVGHAAVGETVRVEQHVVARSLVVVREAGAVVTDAADAPVETYELRLARTGDRLRLRQWIAIGGAQRIGGEEAEDVGEQQLLVLLLVIDAELDQHGEGIGPFVDEALREETRQRLVDVGAIGAHLRRRRPRQEPTQAARLPFAFALVVRIEAVLEVGRELAIVGQVRLQDEALIEPSRMRKVPLRRASVVHWLHRLVLVAQRCRKSEGQLAAGAQTFVEIRNAELGFGMGGRSDRKR
jgi:hypothetical protein